MDFLKSGSFLEIGPGPGYQTSMVAKQVRGVEIKALEYSIDMISIEKDYVKSQNLENRIEFIHGSVEDEGLMNRLGRFDLIFSTFSLHHWSCPIEKMYLDDYKIIGDGLSTRKI